MSEQVSKMIDALDKDDNLEAEIQFKSALTDKVGDVLDTKRKDLAKTFVARSALCRLARIRGELGSPGFESYVWSLLKSSVVYGPIMIAFVCTFSAFKAMNKQ